MARSMVLGLLYTDKSKRKNYFHQVMQSPCRWASLLTLGWAFAIWNDTNSAVHWPGIVHVVDLIGRRATSACFFIFAILPLFAILIPRLWIRIICTTLPLAWWLLILIESLSTTALYTPAIWTAVVCVLSLIQQEIRRARRWDFEDSA